MKCAGKSDGEVEGSAALVQLVLCGFVSRPEKVGLEPPVTMDEELSRVAEWGIARFHESWS